jgi:hypothetical protein
MANRESGKFTDDGSGFSWGEPPCDTCKHKHVGRRSCDAFAIIAVEILVGKNDHRAPYPGDHGIRYEPRE